MSLEGIKIRDFFVQRFGIVRTVANLDSARFGKKKQHFVKV